MNKDEALLKMADLLETACQFLGSPPNWIDEALPMVAWVDKELEPEITRARQTVVKPEAD